MNRILGFDSFIGESASPKTDVIFYVDTDGDVFAYFPNDDADNKGNKTCYSHVGQHSACAPDYVKDLKKATPEEYASLQKELVGQGYTDLNVVNLNEGSSFHDDISEAEAAVREHYIVIVGDNVRDNGDKESMDKVYQSIPKGTRPSKYRSMYKLVKEDKSDW